MKFLIAGLGSIGRRHLRNLLALGEGDITLYRTHQSTLPDSELAGLPVETDLGKALSHQPDAVIVSNPTSLHLEVAIPAAEAGCHILLEKPVSHSWEGVENLIKAVRQSGSQVLVGYQFRFHPGLHQVQRLLKQGLIGRPLTARSHWGEYLPGWHPWEDYRYGYSAITDLGGGVVLTLSHPLDYLNWLFGEVETIWAVTASLGDLEIQAEDTAEILLQFTCGVIASLHLDYIQRPPSHHLEISGSRGTIKWDNSDGAVALYQSIDSPNNQASGSWVRFPADSFSAEEKPFERNDMFLAEMRHFVDIIRNGARPVCTLEDGLKVLELSLAIHRSSREGQKIPLTS